MAEEPKRPSQGPYRDNAWKETAWAAHPESFGWPGELRAELLRLREIAERGELPQSVGVRAASIRNLREGRDRLRRWARPARMLFGLAAGTLLTGAISIVSKGATGYQLAAAFVLLALAAVAGVTAEFWANRWLDLVAEYDGLIEDFRKKESSATRDTIVGAMQATERLGEAIRVLNEVSVRPREARRLRTFVDLSGPTPEATNVRIDAGANEEDTSSDPDDSPTTATKKGQR